MKRMKNRRLKNYLISPKYQLKFIGILVGTNILIIVIVFLAMYLFFKNSPNLYGILQYLRSDESVNFRLELKNFAFILGLILGFFIIFISIFAIVFSHRTAGPIYKFKKTCEQIFEGNHEMRIFLRPNDDFKEAAKSFNLMMDKLLKK